MMLMVNSGEFFECIQKKSGRSTEKIGGLAVDNASVRKFKSSSRCAGLFFFLETCRDNFTVLEGSMCLFQKKFDLTYFLFCSRTGEKGTAALVIAADDLLTGCITAYLIVDDTVSGHIDSHICRRFVRAFAHDLLKHCLKNRENFHITIVINGRLTVSFQMERVDHIDIVQICSGSFICQIDRMFQRNIPDWESFEFGISGSYSTFVFVV